MRVLFMGTPDFAVSCLQALLDAGHEICGVFTKPDKPKGRSFALTMTPVKELAIQHSLQVFQPETLRTQEAVDQIAALRPEIIVVVAYGKILPKVLLDLPPMGCVNVHGSLLPKYRGAAPIQWAVIKGEKVSGVTTMFLGEGVDTGDMLLKAETEIGPDETSGELFDRLSLLGAKLLTETLDGLKAGTITRIPQNDEESCRAPMLNKELSEIDWNKSAQEIHNLIRGLSPWPTASTVYGGKRLKIHQSQVCAESEFSVGKPGTLANGKDFVVCCGNGTALRLVSVQYEGGKRMDAKDFLRGHPLEEGSTVG